MIPLARKNFGGDNNTVVSHPIAIRSSASTPSGGERKGLLAKRTRNDDVEKLPGETERPLMRALEAIDPVSAASDEDANNIGVVSEESFNNAGPSYDIPPESALQTGAQLPLMKKDVPTSDETTKPHGLEEENSLKTMSWFLNSMTDYDRSISWMF